MSPLLEVALVGVLVGPAPDAGAVGAVDAVGAPLELQWEAPESCPDEAALLQMVERYLGTPLSAVTLAAAPFIQAKVSEAEDGRFTLDLVLTSSSGTTERHIDNPACAVLAKATALAAAVAVEVAVAEREELERLEARSEPKIVEPQPPPPAEPEPEPRPPNRFVVAVAAHGMGEFGVLPRGGGGGMLRVAIVAGRWHAAARGEFLTGPPATLEGTDAVGRFLTWTAGAEGCFAPGKPTLSFPLCVHAGAGQIRGEAGGVETAAVSRQILGTIGIGAWIAGYPHENLGLRFGIEGAGHPHTPAFAIDGQVVHRVRPASARLVGGIEARF